MGIELPGKLKSSSFSLILVKKHVFRAGVVYWFERGRLSEQRHDPLIRWAAPLAGDIAAHFITRRRKAMVFYFLILVVGWRLARVR